MRLSASSRARALALTVFLTSSLVACGGGGDTTSSGGTVTGPVQGKTFKGFVNLSHNDARGTSYFGTGRVDLVVGDAAGNATGTTEVNGTKYPTKGTISESSKTVSLTVSPASTGPQDAGGTATGTLKDQTGLWGMVANFDLLLPVGTTGTMGRYTGTVSADTSAAGAGLSDVAPDSGGGGSNGGSSAGGLVGSWQYSSGGQRAVEILSGSASGGTGKARTWSGSIDGYYIEYTWSVSGKTKSTAVTKYIACDFNQGRWVSQSQRPTGNVTFTLTGDTVVYSNAPNTPYTRSSATISAPTAGATCSKL